MTSKVLVSRSLRDVPEMFMLLNIPAIPPEMIALVPAWVPVANYEKKPQSPPGERLLKTKNMNTQYIISDLLNEGFKVVEVNWESRRQNAIRLGVLLRRDGQSIAQERVSEINRLFFVGFSWDGEAFRNPGLGDGGNIVLNLGVPQYVIEGIDTTQAEIVIENGSLWDVFDDNEAVA